MPRRDWAGSRVLPSRPLTAPTSFATRWCSASWTRTARMHHPGARGPSLAKDSTNTGTGATRANMLSRRGLVRDDLTIKERVLDSLFRAPNTGWAILIWGLFIVACGSLASWSRQQPLVAVGRVMNDTALVRVQFELDDREQTEQKKLLVRQQTP